MARVKRGVIAGRRHKKILKKAKGYFNARRKVFRTARRDDHVPARRVPRRALLRAARLRLQGERADHQAVGLPASRPWSSRQVIYKKVLAGERGHQGAGGQSERYPPTSRGIPRTRSAPLLAKYPKGQIDAIWASWDAFAEGAYKALKENGRTEIKLYWIDVSNQDLQLIQEQGSPWVSDRRGGPEADREDRPPRLLAKKIAGETNTDTYDLPAAQIKQGRSRSRARPLSTSSRWRT